MLCAGDELRVKTGPQLLNRSVSGIKLNENSGWSRCFTLSLRCCGRFPSDACYDVRMDFQV